LLRSLLIANRGEIACRVIQGAHRLGIRTVAVYSEADAGARHVRLASEAVCIGPAPAADSYLRVARLVEVALAKSVEGVHPGYGFLSENADFAQACSDAGLIFVGPGPEAIRAMGSKSLAKDHMSRAGVPVVPDYRGSDQSLAAFTRHVAAIGYPAMLKPAYGGGGKGMRRVESDAALAEALAAAKREAFASFGNDEIIAEKFIAHPRHVEVQVFGDQNGDVVHLWERDCTLQRRHQKIIEEAPAFGLPAALRNDLRQAAIRAAKAIHYVNAGTVEFLVDTDGAFYFMEMNTRLQVEHPVTEAITGIDLVEWQFRVASGERLPLRQDDIPCSGHAIEARLYAESPDKGFLPSPGRIRKLSLDRISGTRIDSGVDSGDSVAPYYDPMIAKVIAHGADRDQARRTLLQGLLNSTIEGPDTNLAFLATLLCTRAFQRGEIDIQFVDRHLDQLLPAETPSIEAVAIAMAWTIRAQQVTHGDDPWSEKAGWLLNLPATLVLILDTVDDRQEAVWRFGERGGTSTMTWLQRTHTIDIGQVTDQGFRVLLDGTSVERTAVATAGAIYVIGEESVDRVRIVDPLQVSVAANLHSGAVVAPMPGKITDLLVVSGQSVAAGDRLAVVEAMKMEHVLRAAFDGTVTHVAVSTGDLVDEGAVLVELAPASAQ
jgi:3-methylcrotonyl-CoA carboxylase alpha subunit